MINRNCAITKLLKENDIDIWVTMFDYNNAGEDSHNGKIAWLEMIKKSTGKRTTSSSDKFIVSLTSEKGDIISEKIAGEEIVELIRLLCDNPIAIRISITPKKRIVRKFSFSHNNKTATENFVAVLLLLLIEYKKDFNIFLL